MPALTTGRVAIGGGLVGAALLAALLLPANEPAGLDDARVRTGVTTIGEDADARCVATLDAKVHDGCYLAGALRLVDEQRAATPDWKAAQWMAEAEAYEAGCGPLPDPDSEECAASPFCRGDACSEGRP